MELSWSTFVLEIINFVVLVWILKRFLYKPVLAVIAARRQAVEEQLAEAHATEAEASALKEQYSGRLSAWETEKRAAKSELAREVEQERARRLSELEQSLTREREKVRVADERQQAEKQRLLEQQALGQGASFAGKLLALAAGPELEQRLVEMVLAELAGLPADQKLRLRNQWHGEDRHIDVCSAFDLTSEQRGRLQSALRELADIADVQFRRDPTLVAGVRIEIGAWLLAANLRDELKGFAELAGAGHGGS